MGDRRASAAAAAAGSGVLVGLGIALTKPAEAFVDPVTLALLRYACGTVLLMPFVLWGRVRLRGGRGLVAIALLGILQFAILTVLLNFALLYASAGGVALLFSLFPCLTLVLGYGLGREGLRAWKVVGVILCFIAAGVWVIHMTGQSGGNSGQWIGYLMALGGALCGTVCAVLYRPLLETSSILPFGGVAMLAATAALAPAGLALHPRPDPLAASMQVWLTVLALGLCSAVGYGLWLWAFRHSSPTRVTVFIGLGPIVASLTGAAWFNEPLSSADAGAVALLLVGLWVTQWEELPVRSKSR